MLNKNFIQVFEYQKLRYDDSTNFKEHHFNSMVKFNELNQNKYFTIIHKGVRFENYVGVIKIGELTIEILPKVDNNIVPNRMLWKNILLNMLKICKFIQVDTISEAQLKRQYNSILDIYFELYLTEIEVLVKKGLVKKYRINQSNQNSLKGKLLISKNIQKNLVHKERFYCEHQYFDKNHQIHQILYKALFILKSLIAPSLKDKLNRLLFEFQEINLLDIQKEDFERIVINRKNQVYHKAIDIAKIIILNYSPSLNYGNTNLLTLLFDMNALWEEYIFRILHKHRMEGMEVSFQNSNRFWENKRIRPDIVINYKDEIFVVDTKWKIVEANNPSDNDLKQMFVYNLHWNAQKALLLYPKINQSDCDFGLFHYNNLNLMCKIGFIDITNNTTIKDGKNIATDVFDKFGII